MQYCLFYFDQNLLKIQNSSENVSILLLMTELVKKIQRLGKFANVLPNKIKNIYNKLYTVCV